MDSVAGHHCTPLVQRHDATINLPSDGRATRHYVGMHVAARHPNKQIRECAPPIRAAHQQRNALSHPVCTIAGAGPATGQQQRPAPTHVTCALALHSLPGRHRLARGLLLPLPRARPGPGASPALPSSCTARKGPGSPFARCVADALQAWTRDRDNFEPSVYAHQIMIN